MNRIFGATRTPDASGSEGMVTAAFTGNANNDGQESSRRSPPLDPGLQFAGQLAFSAG